MGKKRSRTKYTSKSERNNVSKSTLKRVREEQPGYDKMAGKMLAWKRGLNPWIVFKNTTSGTNRPFYKVRANDVWGDFKRRGMNIFSNKGQENE